MPQQRPRYVKLFLDDRERAALSRAAKTNDMTIQGLLRSLIISADEGSVVFHPEERSAQQTDLPLESRPSDQTDQLTIELLRTVDLSATSKH